MNVYRSLFKRHRDQSLETVFSHGYAANGNYDEPTNIVARRTLDGFEAWKLPSRGLCRNTRRQSRSYEIISIIRSYTSKTWTRATAVVHHSDLIAVFESYNGWPLEVSRVKPDWVFIGCHAPNAGLFRDHFGTDVPEIACSLDGQPRLRI